MKTQIIKISLIAFFAIATSLSKSQTVTFDTVPANYGYPKPITWFTSNWGSGFGHKIYNDDYSGKTYLKIAGRHNAATFSDILTVSSDGLVGIGTNSPGMKLELAGTANVLSLLKLRNADWACNMSTALEFWNGGNKNFATAKIISQMDGCGNDGEALLFQTQKAGDTWTSTKMGISNGGQVWMGPTRQTTGNHTDYRLAVDGKLVAKEIIVTNQNWADFVFDKGYELPKLTDVELFYKTNKHLPQIPTANEVEENGVNLGEMNKLLLQKIEELTLYMVEQQKRTDKLEKELKEYKTRK